MFKFDRKFWKDTGWNYSSLGVQALVGIVINCVVLAAQGSSSLGVFNQLYAIFVIAGQFSVLGLHDSALKHSSEYSECPEESNLLSVASIVVSVIAGLLCAGCLALLSHPIGRLFESPEVGQGILWLAPGLFLFTINKVLMAILNGQRRMIAFANAQALRALMILIVVLWVIWKKISPHFFGFSFTLAEAVLSIFLLGTLKSVFSGPMPFQDIRRWMVAHFRFGSKALIHGFLSESYIRIDILMLGIFVSDALVGIYSFAAFFLEGVYQISIVFRNITNPILVRLLMAKDLFSLARYTRRTALLSFSATLLIALGVTIVYPHLDFFVPADVLRESYPILMILLAGLVLFSIFVPFDYIFLQAGKPGIQSIYMTMNVASNVFFNYLLIPRYGLYGASIATGISFLFSVLHLNVLTSRVLGLPGGIFIYPLRSGL